MRNGILLVIALTFAVLAFGSTAAAPQPLPGTLDCSVPCGPIPPVITLDLGNTRDLSFPADGKIVLEGEMIYYFDVDQDGYGFDAQNKPVVTFQVPRRVPWAEVDVEPEEIPVPVDDPRYIQQENPNQPDQLKYEYRHPITVTITKERDPTADELKDFLRNDGKYRMLLSAQSNPSTVDQAGYQYGLIEGYGVKEMRFTPQEGANGVGDESEPQGGASPGVGFIALIAAVAGTVVALRRRN